MDPRRFGLYALFICDKLFITVETAKAIMFFRVAQ